MFSQIICILDGMNSPLASCHECDLLQVLPADALVKTSLRCSRCGAPIHGQSQANHATPLALILAAFILFIVANCYPIISIETAGIVRSATILGAVQSLWEEDMPLVAGLVLVTTLLAPAIELLGLTIILACIQFGWRSNGLRVLMGLAVRSRPWSMVEVFVMGVLISVVKISHLANISPGPALWSYGLLILVFSAALANVDSQALWEEIEPDV